MSIAQNLIRDTNAGHTDNLSVSVSNPPYGQVGLMLRGNTDIAHAVRQSGQTSPTTVVDSGYDRH